MSEVDLASLHKVAEYRRLRLATLIAELAEYRGRYKPRKDAKPPITVQTITAMEALAHYDQIIPDLEDWQREGNVKFGEEKNPVRLLLRQKLYFLWQQSVLQYRIGDIGRSRELLDLAIDLADRLDPPSEALRTQLYYGAGKLAFHECKESDAIKMYQKSLKSASSRFDIARRKVASKPDDAFMKNEVEAARYAVAKTLALGLAQCLREQGRLEEAHSQAVAGHLLLNLGDDTELSKYAQVLVSSIERSIAGEHWVKFLDNAAEKIDECAQHFQSHTGEIGYRTRLELALFKMQQGHHPKALQMLTDMLTPPPPPKWVAECNLALSRVARRMRDHKQAVQHAKTSVKAAKAPGLKRILRRAQVVLVLALYDQATENGVDERLLKRTTEEIEIAMDPQSEPDVRTRANMWLTKARVLNVRGEFGRALDAFREYKSIEAHVEVGRIKELANQVKNELTANAFRCPADLSPDGLDLNMNTHALRAYLIRKVDDQYAAPDDRARALSIGRATYYKYHRELEKLGLLDPIQRQERSRHSVRTVRRPRVKGPGSVSG